VVGLDVNRTSAGQGKMSSFCAIKLDIRSRDRRSCAYCRKHPLPCCCSWDRIQASNLSRAARIRSTGFFWCVACRMKTEVRAKGIDAGGCFDLQHSSIAFSQIAPIVPEELSSVAIRFGKFQEMAPEKLKRARLSAADRARHLRQQRLKRPLALPKMWWTDAGHREAYCWPRSCTPFS
jgi:hypothetical protein